MQCTQVSQFLWLGCVLYVTALEAYWCTEASAALLLSFLSGLKVRQSKNLEAIYSVYDIDEVHTSSCVLHVCNPKQYSVEVHNHSTHH